MASLCVAGHERYVCTNCLVAYRHPNTLKSHLKFHCRLRRNVCSDPDVDFRRKWPENAGLPLAYDAQRYLGDGLNATSDGCHPSNIMSVSASHIAAYKHRFAFEVGQPSTTYDGPCHRSLSYVMLHECDSLHFRKNATTVEKQNATGRVSYVTSGYDGDDGPTTGDSKQPYSDNQQQTAVEPSRDDLPSIEHGRRKTSRKGNVCAFCGKVYSRKYGLKIHVRIHTGYKPLKCAICTRPFGDPSNLNKHVRLHSMTRTPYRCELCGKYLARSRDLERHRNSRHPARVQAEKQ